MNQPRRPAGILEARAEEQKMLSWESSRRRSRVLIPA
jgi:hypothetical protein